MDEQEIDSAFELALWDLRRRRSLHFNTIAAKCRRVHSAFTNHQASQRLAVGVREGRVERVGRARYKVLGPKHVHPLGPGRRVAGLPSPPATSPVATISNHSTNSKQLERTIQELVAIQEALLQLTDTEATVESRQQAMSTMHKTLQSIKTGNVNQNTKRLLAAAEQMAHQLDISAQLQASKDTINTLRNTAKQLHANLMDKERQLETMLASVSFLVSELKATLGGLQFDDGAVIGGVEECRGGVLRCVEGALAGCARECDAVREIVEEMVSNVIAAVSRIRTY